MSVFWMKSCSSDGWRAPGRCEQMQAERALLHTRGHLGGASMLSLFA